MTDLLETLLLGSSEIFASGKQRGKGKLACAQSLIVDGFFFRVTMSSSTSGTN